MPDYDVVWEAWNDATQSNERWYSVVSAASGDAAIAAFRATVSNRIPPALRRVIHVAPSPANYPGAAAATSDDPSDDPPEWVGRGPLVNILSYGADPTGVAYSDDALDAAVAWANTQTKGAVIEFPPGDYKFARGGRVISKDRVHVRGAGRGATLLRTEITSGDWITFSPAPPATSLTNVSIRELRIFNSGSNPSAGALVKLDRVYNSHFHDLSLANYYGCLNIVSGGNSLFSLLDFSTGNAFTSRRVGSYLIRIGPGDDGDLPAELHFNDFDWRATANQPYLDYAILITAADGIFFGGENHIGFCNLAALALIPETDDTRLIGVSGGFYFDNISTGAAILCQPPSASFADSFGQHNIDVRNSWDVDVIVQWDCPATVGSVIRIDRGVPHTKGVVINADAKVIFPIARITDADTTGVELGADAANVTFHHLIVNKGRQSTGPVNGMTVANGATNWKVLHAEFADCTNDLVDNSDGTGRVLGSILTDKVARPTTMDALTGGSGLSARNYANDAAAAAAGVPIGGAYHTSGAVKVRLS